MPEFIQYDVTGKITQKWYSADPSVVEGKLNILEIPRDLFNSLTEYHIVDSGMVRIMTQAEKNTYEQEKAQALIDTENTRIAIIDQTMFNTAHTDFPMAKIDGVIDSINNLAGAKIFFKRLVRYLVKKLI